MKQVRNPTHGRRLGKDYPLISVAESHEEHLTVSYPEMAEEVKRLSGIPVPAGFQIEPGKVTGRKLRKAGVQTTLCMQCGGIIPVISTFCETCKKSGGG